MGNLTVKTNYHCNEWLAKEDRKTKMKATG
jgi:hypothetical protein